MVGKALHAIVVALLVWSLSAGSIEAQQGEEQRPPTPAPRPQPQPTPTPAPSTPGQAPSIIVHGRVFTDKPLPSSQAIEVRLEDQSSVVLDTTYIFGSGRFVFRNVRGDQDYYVSVKAEGFKPVREHMDRMHLMRGASFSILLHSEDVVVTEENAVVDREDSPYVVDLKQLQANIPKKAVQEYEKALEESSKGNYNKVIERLIKAVELAPDFYEAQNNLGVQYMRLGRFRDAEASFERARELNPNGARPLINLGSLYFQEGEIQSEAGQAEKSSGTFQKAADLLEEAIRLNPASASAAYYLGAALYKTGSYERSETMLHRALMLDDKMHDVRLMLVNVYTKQHRFDEAMEQLDSYMAQNPDSPRRATLEAIKGQIESVLRR